MAGRPATIAQAIHRELRLGKPTDNRAAVALYFMWNNFGRVHQTLRVTPAMEAGISDHVWSVEESSASSRKIVR